MKPSSASRLVVLLPPRRDLIGPQALDSGTQVTYYFLSAQGLESGRSPIALLPRATRLELAFDPDDVYSANVEAPRLTEAKLRLALPNLLEDKLLTEPADQHIAFAPQRDAQGKLAVAAISRAWLARVLEVFKSTGRTPQLAWSALALLPPPPPGTLSMWLAAPRALLKTPNGEGLGFDLDEHASALIEFAADRAEASRLEVRGQGELGTRLPMHRAELALPNETEFAGVPNLLQAGFAPRRAWQRFDTKQWRAPLAWLGAAGLVAVLGLNLYWFKLDHEARALRTDMLNAFRSAFPQEPAVVDPIAQAKRQLVDLRSRAGLASPDDYSVLMARAAQLLGQAPLGAVEGFEYRDRSLRLQLKPALVQDAALANQLRAHALSLGLKMELDDQGGLRLRASGG